MAIRYRRLLERFPEKAEVVGKKAVLVGGSRKGWGKADNLIKVLFWKGDEPAEARDALGLEGLAVFGQGIPLVVGQNADPTQGRPDHAIEGHGDVVGDLILRERFAIGSRHGSHRWEKSNREDTQ
jgi:hypothetical protein